LRADRRLWVNLRKIHQTRSTANQPPTMVMLSGRRALLVGGNNRPSPGDQSS
jgi:hypothetical protein